MHLNLLRQFRLGAANREPLCLHDCGQFQSESFCLWVRPSNWLPRLYRVLPEDRQPR